MADLKDLPAVKRQDIRPCEYCGDKLRTPHFYTLELKSCILDMRAVQRQAGMEMIMGGNPELADILGTQEPLARVATSSKYTICGNCISKPDLVLYLMEKSLSEEEK